MIHNAIVASALAPLAAAAGAGLLAPLTCGPSGPSYSVSLDGAPLFSNPPPLAVFMGGAWATSFVLAGSGDVTGSDALGTYTGTECAYALSAVPAATVFKVGAYSYAAPEGAPHASAVRFRHSFPLGAPGSNRSAAPASYSTVSNFPAFKGPGTPLPDVLTWRDAFFGPSNSLSDTLGQSASAVVFYNGKDVAQRAVFLSPLDQFLNAALGDDLGGAAGACPGSDAGCWAAGASATVTSIPPGFSHSWVLVAATGFTATVDAWGSVLRSYYGATSVPIPERVALNAFPPSPHAPFSLPTHPFGTPAPLPSRHPFNSLSQPLRLHSRLHDR